MAGAEGQPRLDLHGQHAMGDGAGVMRAIDKKAPGPHGGQAFLAQADPVLVGQGRNGDLARADARQIGGIGRLGVQRLHHRIFAMGFFGDQHRLGAAVQLQRRGNIGSFDLGQRDAGLPEGGIYRHGLIIGQIEINKEIIPRAVDISPIQPASR